MSEVMKEQIETAILHADTSGANWRGDLRDNIFATLATAQAEADALKAEVARLREDKARLDWLQSEMNDVRWIAGAGNQMCSPSDEVGVRIISHWQAEPCERVETERWGDDLRAAIDEARTIGSEQP